MSRASIHTLLSLDRFIGILGIDPRHFAQVTTTARPVFTCSTVWKQHVWQESGQVGREDVALAIQQAEQLIGDHVGYELLPNWVVDNRIQVPRPGIPEVFNTSLADARGFPLTIQLRNGHFISGGIEAKTLIEAGAAVTYTDEDGDGYPETATITVTTTVTDPDEIAVYMPGESGRDEWEVRPLNNPLTRRRSVSIAAGIATIVCAREQLVDPDLWEAYEPTAVDGDVDSNFLATVDVYRHWNDPQQQVTLMWAPRGICSCNGAGTCAACEHSTQTGCLLAKDYRLGIVHYRPATWDSDDGEFDMAAPSVYRAPDNLRLWYYAGHRDMTRDAPTLEMGRQLERAITYLALTFIGRPLCGCNNIQALVKSMTDDLARNISTEAGSSSYQLTSRILDNPWGTQRGAVMAWQLINQGNRALGQAVLL